jgi:hypothetical protein
MSKGVAIRIGKDRIWLKIRVLVAQYHGSALVRDFGFQF